MKHLLFSLLFSSFCPLVYAQYTHADSLRGGYGGGRYWWDVKHYELDITFNPATKEISGSNTITFSKDPNYLPEMTIRQPHEGTLQVDLQDPLKLDSVVFYFYDQVRTSIAGSIIPKEGYSYFITPPDKWDLKAETCQFEVFYHGKPRQAVNAPWDGGVIWTKDNNGNPWITIACQGLGASAWYPCKDTQADEVESARMHFTCDSKLVCVSNGRFEGKEEKPGGLATYSWAVSSPINNYCIIPYIGDYVNIHEHFPGENGMLELDYWVLRGNEAKAEAQFADAPRTIEALEHWFGPYPFYEDGYKLIEAPHLGMEHQSAIAYGNKFRNGYMGTDLSKTGEGLKWDYIIVHESGHEWFGNSITTKDIADMWVHEAFTDYSETLFTEYWFGKESATKYIIGLRGNIDNDKPIIGDYEVNSEGSGDMYYKGANMLHTIRQLVGNDSVFRNMLRGLNKTFYHQTVTTQQIEQYMIDYTKLDLKPVFDQYLRQRNPPTLQLIYTKTGMKYRWINSVKGFNMRISMQNGIGITPTSRWQKLEYSDVPHLKGATVQPTPDPNFYLFVQDKYKKGYRNFFQAGSPD